MSAERTAQQDWFEAFIKAAQYIVRLKSQQDVWDHLAKLIVTYFPALWVAFARRDSVQEISIHHSTLRGEVAGPQILSEEVRALIEEVLDSGFLASHVVAVPTASMTALLPIVKEYQAKEVMLVGHQTADPLPKELLDVYLAVASLAGTAFERLDSERELSRHRAHLEELVKERTAALAHAKRQNELILHSVREGICGVDLEGGITFLNPFAGKILGWEPAELIGRDAHHTFHHTRSGGCDYPAEECVLHATLACGAMREAANEEFFRKDGTRFPVEFRTAPLMEEGKLVGAVIVFQDITERKEAEQVLLAAKAAAEAANQAKSQFLANMSHELRTPMNAILGLIDVALPKAADPIVEDCLKTAQGSASVLLTLLNDLLDSAKIESGKVELESAAFSLRQMLDQLARVLAVRASEKGLSFSWRVPDGAPDAVIGDRMRLQQVLINLAGNAIKFTARGEVEVSLRVVEEGLGEQGLGIGDWGLEDGARPVTSESEPLIPNPQSLIPPITMEFAVRDTGIGISPAGRERLFQRFAQADASMSRRFGGTGLGLSICKSLVEMMGGRIWVESELGVGSTFYFTVRLPLAKELPASLETPMAVPAATCGPLRVLLVEDNPANQKLAKYVLKDRGHVVEIAGDGQRAICLTEQNHYDVILMDVQMPGINGLEATAAIREQEKGLGRRE